MSIFQNAQDRFVTAISNSAAFQEFVSAVDADSALSDIHQDALPRPAAGHYTSAIISALRPYCMVYYHAHIDSMRLVRIGTQACFRANGMLQAHFTRNYPDGTDPDVADAALRTIMGNIAVELAQQYETGGLAADELICSGPHRVDDEHLQEEGDHQWFTIDANFGFQV